MQCLCCQRIGTDEEIQHGYHGECAERLFGTEIPPAVPFSIPDIVTESQKMVGKMSVSGVQPKLSEIHNRKKRQMAVQTIYAERRCC